MNNFLRPASLIFVFMLFAAGADAHAGPIPVRVNGVALTSSSPKKPATKISQASSLGSSTFLGSLIHAGSQINVLSQIEYKGYDVNREYWFNPTTVTVTDSGSFTVWVYVNEHLGYVSPKDGSLLHCERYRIPGRNVETPLVDCEVTGNIESIPNLARYPDSAGGGYLRLGDDFYYPGNTTAVLRTAAKHWKYENGFSLYDASQGIWRWTNGNRIIDTLSRNLLYPTGSRLYSETEGELRYVSQFYFSRRDASATIPTRFDVRYPDGFSHLVRAASNIRYISYPPHFNSIYDLSRLENQDRPSLQRVTMYYPSGDWTLLKQDTDPYEGATYETNGAPTFLVKRRYPFEHSGMKGEVVIDADPASDFVGVFQLENVGAHSLVHAVLQQRTEIPAPQNPGPITTRLNGSTLDFSWAAASPVSTPKYLFAWSEGFFAPTLCTGGATVTNSGGTITYPLAGVSAGKTYSVRICGWDPDSDRRSTGTPWTVTVSAPPGAPSLWISSPGTLTSLRVLITPASDGIPVTAYRISIRPGTELSEDWAKTCPGSTEQIGQVESHTLRDLAANEGHWVKVCAVGEGGELSLPALSFGRTDSDIPNPPRTPLAVFAFTERSIGIRWTTLGDYTPKYQGPVSYRVGIVAVPPEDPSKSPPADCGMASGQSLDAGEAKQLLIGNLLPATRYRIRVCALSAAGELSVGNPTVDTQTASQALSLPVMLPLEKLPDGSTRVRFQVPQGTSTGVTYSLFVRDELGAGAWSPAAAMTATTDGQVLEWVDRSPPSAARFYQVRR